MRERDVNQKTAGSISKKCSYSVGSFLYTYVILHKWKSVFPLQNNIVIRKLGIRLKPSCGHSKEVLTQPQCLTSKIP